MSPRARQAKNKARIKAYDKLVERGLRTAASGHGRTIRIPFTKRLGNKVVVEAKGVTKGFGEQACCTTI